MGTRFLAHYSASAEAVVLFREEGGVSVAPTVAGHWDWVILRVPHVRIEVIEEGEFL